MGTLEQIAAGGGTSEGAKAALGLLACMENFETVLGLQICLKVFSPCEEMANSLQAKDIDARTVTTLRNGLIRYLTSMRTEDAFDRVYREAASCCKDLDLGSPSLPRKRRRQRKIGDYLRVTSAATDHEWDSPLQYYRQQYYRVLDLVLERASSRLNCSTLDHLTAIEDLLVNAANGDTCEIGDLLKKNLDGDIDQEMLKSELKLLPAYLQEWNPRLNTVTSIGTIMECMQHRNTYKILRQTHILIKLYLTVPISNATAERSLSGLRRVKSYLRSTMNQDSLNSLVSNSIKVISISINTDTGSIIRRNRLVLTESCSL